MKSYSWIKLYHEILEDPKMARMPDYLWRRTIELFLMAGSHGLGGMLPSLSDMAWKLRMEEDRLEQNLRALEEIGVVATTELGWMVTNFAKRQDNANAAERKRQQRARDKISHAIVTTRDTDREKNKKRIREEEEKRREPLAASALSTPLIEPISGDKNITQIIAQSTGMVCIPPGESERIEQIHSLVDAYGSEKVIEVFTQTFKRWTMTRRKDGSGTYRRTNFGWVDLAQEVLSGGSIEDKPMTEGEKYLAATREWSETVGRNNHSQ